MEYFIVFILGLVLGGLVVYLVYRNQRKQADLAFSALSREALKKNSEDFLLLANQAMAGQSQKSAGELDTKKQLIDLTLQTIRTDLVKVEKLLNDSETARVKSAAEISANLRNVSQQTEKLQATTSKLQAALANTQTRGQWGERMAEDVLRFAGFIEGVNYLKQKTQETVATRPDYTFLLPQNLKLNMDIKFPLDSYLKYMSEEHESTREGYKVQFLRDARQRIKEVTTRDYINPSEQTLDYVLVFVPSEQVYNFIQQFDREILEESLRNKVVLCSPFTLYAILALIRQQVDNFTLQSTASQVLALMGTFDKQWTEYKKCHEALGNRIQQTAAEYEKLAGIRTRTLDRSLKKIDDLRKEKGIPEASLPELKSPDEPEEREPGKPT
ncbi:MAG TPA: DNA recombination protein RmuC [Dehalococcoidales bacterium]|nr:DNA recombination protein RmuC [Dehalococcoidales bacterium]